MKTIFYFLILLVLFISCNKEQEFRKLKTDFLVGDTLITVGEILDIKNTSDSISVNYIWNFGDGKFSYDKHPIHSFTKPGVYAVKLKLKDNYGNTDSITHKVRIGERYIYEIELLTIDEYKYFSPSEFWDKDSTGIKVLPDIYFVIYGLSDFNHTTPLYKTRTIYNVNQNNMPISFQIPDIKITPFNDYEMGLHSFGIFLYDKDENDSEEMMSNWMSGVSGSNLIYNKIEHKGEFRIGIFGSFKVRYKIK